jgi:hypothetical protein
MPTPVRFKTKPIWVLSALWAVTSGVYGIYWFWSQSRSKDTIDQLRLNKLVNIGVFFLLLYFLLLGCLVVLFYSPYSGLFPYIFFIFIPILFVLYSIFSSAAFLMLAQIETNKDHFASPINIVVMTIFGFASIFIIQNVINEADNRR